MEDKKCFCHTHKSPYTQYCDVCEQPFCNNCPPHDKEHPLLPLQSVLGPETLAQYFRDAHRTVTLIDWGLVFLSQMAGSLIDPRKEEDLADPLAELREDSTTKARGEEQKDKKLQTLAVVTGRYEAIKMRVKECLDTLDKIKDSVNSKYGGRAEEAYEVLMQLKGVPQALTECVTEVNELEGKVEDITSVNILDEVWLLNTFQKLDDYIKDLGEVVPSLEALTERKIREYKDKIPDMTIEVMRCEGLAEASDKINRSLKVLGEKRTKEIDAQIHKIEREIAQLEYSANSPEENAKRAKKKEQELEEANDNLAALQNIYDKLKTEIKQIPGQLREANEQLGNIMKKRMTTLENATTYFERAKLDKDWIVKMLAAQKAEVERELKSLLIYKGVEVIKMLGMNEKKIMLGEAVKKLDQIESQHKKLSLQILNKKAEINRIGEHFRTVKKDSSEFQDTINNMHFEVITQTLSEIEKSKNDIEESKQVQCSQLMNIINTLMAVESDIEKSIAQMVADFEDCKSIPLELEENLKSLTQQVKTILTQLKAHLERELSAQRDNYTACRDGKLGRAKLVCGHWMCYTCFFKERRDDGDEEKTVCCVECGGAKEEIGKFGWKE